MQLRRLLVTFGTDEMSCGNTGYLLVLSRDVINIISIIIIIAGLVIFNIIVRFFLQFSVAGVSTGDSIRMVQLGTVSMAMVADIVVLVFGWMIVASLDNTTGRAHRDCTTGTGYVDRCA